MGASNAGALPGAGSRRQRSNHWDPDRGSKVAGKIRSYSNMGDGIVRVMKALVCPHCHTSVPETASVCTGCGSEVVRGLTRRQRSFVGVIFVAIAILLFGVFLQAYEIAHGQP